MSGLTIAFIATQGLISGLCFVAAATTTQRGYAAAHLLFFVWAMACLA